MAGIEEIDVKPNTAYLMAAVHKLPNMIPTLPLGGDMWLHLREQFKLRNDIGLTYKEKGKYQCDGCEAMSRTAAAAGMQQLPCFGLRGKTCVRCVIDAHRCSFTKEANAKKRKLKEPTPDDSSDVESESASPQPTKARKTDVSGAGKRVPDDSSDEESALPLAQVGSSSSRTASAAAQAGLSLAALEPGASTSETPKSGTSKPEKPSLEDIQRYRRKLHRRLESSLAFLSKAQSELHPDGGREIAALPDLLKEIVEDLDEVRNTAQGLLRELD